MDEQLNYVRDALDRIKRVAVNQKEYWHARDLMSVLDYKEWRDFFEVIERAKSACEMSGNFIVDHFVHAPELVPTGSGAKRERDNWILSRYACYLIAMNGDSRKPEIAASQTYFALQTQRQEQIDHLSDQERRILQRNRVKEANKKLSGAAKEAGVRSQMFGVFQDAGYKGLYGGRGLRAIKSHKGISDKEDLLDCIGRAELAANEFRATQTEEKLRIDRIKGEQNAIATHEVVGKRVRQAIKDIGGTLPEDMPTEPSIKKLAAAKAREQKRLGTPKKR